MKLNLSYFVLSGILLGLASQGPAFVAAEDDDESEDFFDACMDSDLDAIVKFLGEDPALLNKYSEEGESCLMLSSIEQDLDVVKLLVEKGADINARAEGEENHRMPVIGWHTLAGNTDAVSYLIKQGVDINPEFDGVDDDGEAAGIFTPVDLMDFVIGAPERMGEDAPEIDEEIEEMLNDYKAIRELLVANGGRKYVGSEEM